MNRESRYFFKPILLCTGLFLSAQGAYAANPVAKVGDTVLTDEQLHEEIGMQLFQIENNMYNVKKNWVDQKAMNILFDQAAKAAGLSREKWEKREINAKAAPPDENRVNQLLPRFAKPGVDSGEAMRQAREQVANMNIQTRRYQVYQELAKKTPVEFMLKRPEAPRINVTYSPDDPMKGNPKAPVTIVEFTDFQCSFCQRSQATLHQIEQAYPKDVKIVSRQYPLPFHDRAKPAAEAAFCAQEQGKYWEYRTKLFEKMQLSDDDLRRYAKELHLNTGKFDKCLTSHKYAKRVEKDMAEGQKFGVTGTPAFFVNGEFISGAQPFETFDAAVKSALAQKK